MARPSNSALRRREIVDAFIAVMARDGYAGATVARVAKAAGLAPGLLHYHFAGKEEILLTSVSELAARLEQRFERRLERAGDSPRASVLAFVDAFTELGDDADAESVRCWVVLGSQSLVSDELRTAYRGMVEAALARLRVLLEAVLRTEGRETDRVEALAASLFCAVEGAFRLGVVAPEAITPGFAAPALRSMAHALIDSQRRTS